MSDGRGKYMRCETNGCKKKATTMAPYRHCKPHALVRAATILKGTPSLMWAVVQVIEFEVERQFAQHEAGKHKAGNEG